MIHQEQSQPERMPVRPAVASKTSGIAGRATRLVPTLTAILSGVAAAVFLFLALQTVALQLFIIAGAFTIVALVATFASSEVWQLDSNNKLLILIAAVEITIVILAALVNGTGILLGIFGLLYALIVSTAAISGRPGEYAISIGLVGAVLAAIVQTVSPFTPVIIPSMNIIIPIALAVLLMVFITMFAMELVAATLRIKLTIGALAIALLPLLIVSLIQTQFVQSAIKRQTDQALLMAANQTANRVDTFIQSNLDSILLEAELPVVSAYMQLDPGLRIGSPQEDELRVTLNTLRAKQQSYPPSYGILNMVGVDVFDTSSVNIGSRDRYSAVFQQPASTGTAYVTPVTFSPINGEGYIFFSAPIRNPDGKIIGVLRTKYDARILQSLLTQDVGLIGSRSNPILVDSNGLRLADTVSPSLLYKSVSSLSAAKVSELQAQGLLPPDTSNLSASIPELSFTLENLITNPYFTAELHKDDPRHLEAGVVVKLSTQPWYVTFVQEQTAILAIQNEQTRLSTLIAALIAGLVGFAATIVSQSFSAPITHLTETATRISSGDYSTRAEVESSDEIGTLSEAFNSMTGQLAASIVELEDRVQARTHELAEQNTTLVFRTRQLQTVADVARGIVTTQDLETLLNTVVRLISDRFGFYHVGIFLLDEKAEFAQLRASNSVGGQRMLARQHRLRVGQVGIVGYVTGTGQPRIATDVGQDATFFNNPDLPDTRSEMALPLKIGTRVIGALDVQSVKSEAFTQEDIDLFSTLADQVAVAISNNLLYLETLRALEESQEVHRQYLQQEWGKLLADRGVINLLRTSQGSIVKSEETPESMSHVLETGEPIVTSADTSSPDATMAVPIKLRGETIGVIHLSQHQQGDFAWESDDVTTVQSVADQVGLALENARLFEQTVRRAERERRVLEITGQIRSTNNPKEMLEIAARELQRVLGASRAQILVRQPEVNIEETPEPDAPTLPETPVQE